MRAPAWARCCLRVYYEPAAGDGIAAPGKMVTCEGALAKVAPQVILTDLLVDRIYPVSPRQATSIVARVKNRIVGTERRNAQGGRAVFLGYRPRGDQSRSLGYEARNWFEILDSLGAYAGTGRFGGVNDNTEHVSRTGEYLACRFPRTAAGIAVLRAGREAAERRGNITPAGSAR